MKTRHFWNSSQRTAKLRCKRCLKERDRKEFSIGEQRLYRIWSRHSSLNVVCKFFHMKRGLGGEKEFLEILACRREYCRGSGGFHFVGLPWGLDGGVEVLLDLSYLSDSGPETVRAAILVRIKICLTLCPGSMAS